MNDSFVSSLRDITEEGNLDTILKSSLGGYTKKSVQDYLAVIKNQQKTLKEAYLAELARVQAERDAQNAEIEALKQKLQNAENACRAEYEAQIAQMHEEYDALEKDMDEAISRIQEDEIKLSQSRTNGVMLDSANDKIAGLTALAESRAEEIEQLKASEKQLLEELAQEKNSDLKNQVEKLLADIDALNNEIIIRDSELQNRSKRLESLLKQEENNHALLDRLQGELSSSLEQNEWLESENNALGQRLKEQMEESIAYSRENSRLKSAVNILQRKLDSVQLKLNAY